MPKYQGTILFKDFPLSGMRVEFPEADWDDASDKIEKFATDLGFTPDQFKITLGVFGQDNGEYQIKLLMFED